MQEHEDDIDNLPFFVNKLVVENPFLKECIKDGIDVISIILEKMEVYKISDEEYIMSVNEIKEVFDEVCREIIEEKKESLSKAWKHINIGLDENGKIIPITKF